MKTLLIALVAVLASQTSFAAAPRLSCGNGQAKATLTAYVAGNGYLSYVTYTEQYSQAKVRNLYADAYKGAKGDQFTLENSDATPIHVYLPKDLAPGMHFVGVVNSAAFKFANVPLFCEVI